MTCSSRCGLRWPSTDTPAPPSACTHERPPLQGGGARSAADYWVVMLNFTEVAEVEGSQVGCVKRMPKMVSGVGAEMRT
ncbi:hypothetical protein ATI61_1332 [Archangium gephyra]|uniref:Uncharacterized protein n=1 Tax=Archangium gephyra TaxID=48 RepID=A0ABX9JK56_9BACT|nr:hypothetical protein ATI61_1332 [Archangium gephyra]